MMEKVWNEYNEERVRKKNVFFVDPCDTFNEIFSKSSSKLYEFYFEF